MNLKTIIYRTFHLGATLRNYEKMEKYIEVADNMIEKQGEHIQELELELETLKLSDYLYQKLENMKRTLGGYAAKLKCNKDEIKMLKKEITKKNGEFALLVQKNAELNDEISRLKAQMQANVNKNLHIDN